MTETPPGSVPVRAAEAAPMIGAKIDMDEFSGLKSAGRVLRFLR